MELAWIIFRSPNKSNKLSEMNSLVSADLCPRVSIHLLGGGKGNEFMSIRFIPVSNSKTFFMKSWQRLSLEE